MNRITATPNYAVSNCSDLCGNLARYDNDSGAMTCERNTCDECIILKAFQRLKEYEDTGFSPDDIRNRLMLAPEPYPNEKDWENFWRRI